MENKKCSIDGCERPYLCKGFCSLHYYRKSNPNLPMVPNKLTNKPDQMSLCIILGCSKPYYAKGLCHTHHELKRRNGKPIYIKDMPLPKCSVEGCETEAGRRSSLCRFHLLRKYRGIDLTRPKGIKGELNPNWNGGTSEYPNHYIMKKIRKEKLEKVNYICEDCGVYTDSIHHVDLSKDNHSEENFKALCDSCHAKYRRSPKSKYRSKYGKTILELSNRFGVSSTTIVNLEKKNYLEVLLTP